ncbi:MULTISPECIES: hypothetical protein [Bacillaceae]|uniref:Uncharacterized protein n=1 Tax=Evansella alkalicola TaxID=745819 RepID=A0ABS6JUB3_9BACI|nr:MULTISPECIES: hypothetical protein [Bacillaceae]MBU9720822.1 hypothetical protein [Bacillus alkalicola]
MKAWLTPICFLMIPVFYVMIGLIGLSLYGVVFWTGATVLTILGAYFTKFLPGDVETAT